MLLALSLGRFQVSPADLVRLVAASVSGAPSGLPPAAETVIWNIRGPRILAAALVGGALAVAGAAFQGLFRNPLVSPDILGASSGAALGAVVGILFSLPVLGIQALAFAGGLVAVGLVYLVGSLLRGGDTVSAENVRESSAKNGHRKSALAARSPGAWPRRAVKPPRRIAARRKRDRGYAPCPHPAVTLCTKGRGCG